MNNPAKIEGASRSSRESGRGASDLFWVYPSVMGKIRSKGPKGPKKPLMSLVPLLKSSEIPPCPRSCISESECDAINRSAVLPGGALLLTDAFWAHLFDGEIEEFAGQQSFAYKLQQLGVRGSDHQCLPTCLETKQRLC